MFVSLPLTIEYFIIQYIAIGNMINIAITLFIRYYKGKGGYFAMRKGVTFTLPEELVEKLKKVSKETMIPQAKLVEKALEDMLSTYK